MILARKILSYPNGWFSISKSNELKVGDVKEMKICGRHIVLFRGTNSKPYALDAYCPHVTFLYSTNRWEQI